MKTWFRALLSFLLAFGFCGCEKSKRNHIEEFKHEFEELAPTMRGGTLRSVYLAEEGIDSLKIDFVINSVASDIDRRALEKAAPSVAYSILKNVTKLQEVADSGVKIRVVFISSDAVELTNSFLDKSEFKYLEPAKAGRNRMARPD